MDKMFNVTVPEITRMKSQEEKDRAVEDWMRKINREIRRSLAEIVKEVEESV